MAFASCSPQTWQSTATVLPSASAPMPSRSPAGPELKVNAGPPVATIALGPAAHTGPAPAGDGTAGAAASGIRPGSAPATTTTKTYKRGLTDISRLTGIYDLGHRTYRSLGDDGHLR